MNKKYLSWIFSFLFTFAFLFFLFGYVSLTSILEVLMSIPVEYLALGFISHLFAYLFRALFLYMFIGSDKVPFSYLIATHFVHNLYNHIIPASLGELTFPFLLRKKVNMSKGFAALLILRLMTIGFSLLLFILSLFFLFHMLTDLNLRIKINTLLLILAMVLIFTFSIYKYRKIILNTLLKSQLIKKIYDKVLKIFTEVKQEIIKLKTPLFLFKAIILAFSSIGGIVFFYIIILKGLNIHLSFFQTIFVSSIGLAFLILPVKSIGGFGTTEGAWAIGMILLGYSKELSIQSGFAIHIFALVNVTILFIVGSLFRYFKR